MNQDVKKNKVMVIYTVDGEHMCLELLTTLMDSDREELVHMGYDLLTSSYRTVTSSQISHKEIIDVRF